MNALEPSLFDELARPFDTTAIRWRVGATTKDKDKGIALAYVDARDVMDRLDDVLGPDNWQCRYSHAANKTVCEIGIRLDGEWVWKADGAGDTDYEGEKGALSDAFKRAGVRWGIGRYLYHMDNAWVPIEAKGKSYVIAQSAMAELANAHAKCADMQTWGPREDRYMLRIMLGEIQNFGTMEDITRFEVANESHLRSIPVDAKEKIAEAIERVRGKLEAVAA